MSMSASTLSCCPSPHQSPHYQSQPIRSRAPDSGPSPRTPTAFSPPAKASPRPYHAAILSSPKQHRPVNARLPSSSSQVSPRNTRHLPSDVVSGSQNTVRYVNAGTQYSPDGYPPTAGPRVAAPTVEQQPPGSAGKKRKEITREQSPSRMTTANQAAASAAPVPAPNEPQPRIDPSSASETSADSSRNAQALPERLAEPQEARSTHGHSSAPKRARAEPGKLKIMPRAYETCNPKDLGILISNMLMELIRLNDQIPLRDGKLTRFHSRAPPGISVSDYLQRLIQHATLSPPIMLSMVYYIDRLCALYSAFTINSLTVHRFLITAATVAAKGLSDSFWTNPTYARIGGIPVGELATLELEFLQKVQWKIVPKPETLVDYYTSLVDRTDGYELEPRQDGMSTSASEGSSAEESPALSEEDQMNQDPT